MLDKNMTFQDFKNILAEYLGISNRKLQEDTNILYDLGVDSLSLVNTIIRMEHELGVILKNESKIMTKTLGEAYRLFVTENGEKGE